MSMEIHNPDDTCAPFPHRVVINPASERMVKGQLVIKPEYRSIICTACDHLISRDVPDCDCPTSCHEVARLLADLRETL